MIVSGAPLSFPRVTRRMRRVSSLSLLLFVISLGRATHAEVRELWLSETITRCPEPIELSSSGQLTLELPEEVQVAAPAQRGALIVHIAPQLVVIQPQDPLRWAQRAQVGLTVILKGGGRLYCEFTPPKRPHSPDPRAVSVLRFRRPAPYLEVQRAALRLLKQAQEGTLSLDPMLSERERIGLQEVQRSLIALQHDAHQKLSLRELSARPLELSERPPVRVQEGLIYLTLTQRFRLGEHLYVRATLMNRSQPSFQISTFELKLPTGDSLPVSFYPQPLTASPDGRPRRFAFLLPISALKGSAVQPTLLLTATDGRALSLSLPQDP